MSQPAPMHGMHTAISRDTKPKGYPPISAHTPANAVAFFPVARKNWNPPLNAIRGKPPNQKSKNSPRTPSPSSPRHRASEPDPELLPALRAVRLRLGLQMAKIQDPESRYGTRRRRLDPP